MRLRCSAQAQATTPRAGVRHPQAITPVRAGPRLDLWVERFTRVSTYGRARSAKKGFSASKTVCPGDHPGPDRRSNVHHLHRPSRVSNSTKMRRNVTLARPLGVSPEKAAHCPRFRGSIAHSAKPDAGATEAHRIFNRALQRPEGHPGTCAPNRQGVLEYRLIGDPPMVGGSVVRSGGLWVLV
jgi:hypothetical protein